VWTPKKFFRSWCEILSFNGRDFLPILGAVKPSELFDLSGEVAVIIGGTGALGGAIAHGLGEAGAFVALVGRNAERGRERADQIRLAGGRAEFFAADALQKESLVSAQEQIRRAVGQPSILVNAAGGTDPKATASAELAFEQIALADWTANFDLNLVGGVLLPCQVFGPAMVERGRGSVINLASVSGHLPLSRVVAYSAAKAAVINLTCFLAREWAPRGVRVNSITPGFFPAEQNRKLLFNEDGSPSTRTQAIWGHTPMGRFGKPEQLVGAALLLASEKAGGFMTGADIRVDGGFLAQTI
jgi:NAD(P)-dependent dehydrogenase (short-subunit alcohol dehydrogenase family)